MSEVTLAAEPGRTTGTRPSRRLRATGRVPGVIYGGGSDAIAVSFAWPELRAALSTDAGTNAVIRIDVEGESHVTLLRDLQRDPVRREVIHVDFVRFDASKPVQVEVPLVLVGDPKQVTVNGGMVEQRLMLLSVEVRPDAIPNEIEVDISEMELDDSIVVGDLALPAGSVALTESDEMVVSSELTRAALVGDEERRGRW